MQQCDQTRAALICDAAFAFDPGANLARRSRQGLADPGLEFVLLLARQPAGAALVAEARQALDPVFLIQAEPGPDRVVVDQQHSGDRLAAHPVVQQHQRIGATRETMGGRPVANPSRASSIRSCRDSLSRKPRRIIRSVETGSRRFARGFWILGESRYTGTYQREIPNIAAISGILRPRCWRLALIGQLEGVRHGRLTLQQRAR